MFVCARVWVCVCVQEFRYLFIIWWYKIQWQHAAVNKNACKKEKNQFQIVQHKKEMYFMENADNAKVQCDSGVSGSADFVLIASELFFQPWNYPIELRSNHTQFDSYKYTSTQSIAHTCICSSTWHFQRNETRQKLIGAHASGKR